MQLTEVHSIKLTPTVPFNFDATFHKPDHFTAGDNHWRPGTRWQTWRWLNQSLGIKFTNLGRPDKPELQVNIYSHSTLTTQFVNSLTAEIRYRYNLDLDLTEFNRTFASDKTLGPIINRWRGMRPGHPNSLYEYLIIGILLQNATVKRSAQMFQALLERYGTTLEFAGRKLWCFWSPGSLPSTTEAELRTLKVGYRAKSIKRIDDAFAAGRINELELRTQNRDTQMEQLLALYGVGPATVWYLLFDVFHHWDFFNHISPWEQKIYSKLFFNRDPAKPVPVNRLLRHFEHFRPYQQLAVHYLWENLWWQRKNAPVPWLEQLIRL